VSQYVWSVFTTSIPVKILMEKDIKNKIRTRNKELRNTTKTAKI